MADLSHTNHPLYNLLPIEIDGVDDLARLALDMRWSWNHAAHSIWEQLEPDLWIRTHNPWVVLQTAARDRIQQVLSDPGFRNRVQNLIELSRRRDASDAWFQKTHSGAPLGRVAYFSMEFMLSEALPIYSGGLGNVAGDQLKAASDLGIPVIGVGLLYQQGYFRQTIDAGGAQQALYPFNDPGQLPVVPLRRPDGEWLRFEVDLPGFTVWLRTWQVEVGRLKLFLLDSNDPGNFLVQRGITSELYGGGVDLRLKQEILLGIGGWRLLSELGMKPDVCHLNEGHAAFAALERARDFMTENGQPFDVALAATRVGNLFTTHTAVPAGFDRFPPDLVAQYLGGYAQERLGISTHDLLALGRNNPADAQEPFNMAYLAMRGSGSINGVSRLHAAVSRRLFASIFPRWPESEVPVGHVTNGVHMPTWESPASTGFWRRECGQECWLDGRETLAEKIRAIPDERIWQLRTDARKALVEYARVRVPRQLAASDRSAEDTGAAAALFSPDALTLGFARRFAAYKRPNLLLHDPERLVRILTNPFHPVQLVIAGKAHPADEPGRSLVQQWHWFIRRPEVQNRVAFLNDYDMLLAQRLVQGVDVWINTPRRPWEASGTSGMKVLVNGGLNLSELDGWWAEAYTPEVGWAIGDGREHGDDPVWDAAEADALYDLLERTVIPEFYQRDGEGIPRAWVGRIRESMARLAPQFSATRTVEEYTEEHYLRAAASFSDRAKDGGAAAARILEWQRRLDEQWSSLRFGNVRVETVDGQHRFEAEVYPGGLDPESICVEIYADAADGGAPARETMTRGGELDGGGWIYCGSVPSARPVSDYTARVIPALECALVPLEAGHILWQR